jgi:GntR family transcriptional regulator, transcriptional repressor for pyruvate dehydrogenase complex
MTTAFPRDRNDRGAREPEGSTEQVVSHVRGLIERGEIRPGDRLPAERDLALQIGVSRPTVRAGLRALAAMGVVQSRHGSGTFIPAGPPSLGTEALSFLAALHGFTREEMYEARRILEVGAAGLAAERATSDQIATLAEEVAGMFAAMDEPELFLVHDINFHRAVASASANPIVASLVEMVSALYYESRRDTAARASDRDLRDAAEMHRKIYQAIRAHDAQTARDAMQTHLIQASAHQAQEGSDADVPRQTSNASRGRARRRTSPS